MIEQTCFTCNNLNVKIVCSSLLFNSIIFGLYLPNPTGNQTGKTKNNTLDFGTRSIGLDRNRLWAGYKTNGGWIVKVPYINNLDPEVNKLFLRMVQMFEKNSCIRWVPYTNERQFVRVRSNTPGNYPPGRCYAIIGRGYSESYIHLSKQCLKLPPFNYNRKPEYYNVAHEMMHALNFAHEHQRRDRDCYIYFTGNAPTNDFTNYEVYREQETDLTFPYDEESIMQYPDPSIRSKFNKRIGPTGDYPNEMDWSKVNFHYCWGKHYCELNSIANQRCQQHKQIQQQCFGRGLAM